MAIKKDLLNLLVLNQSYGIKITQVSRQTRH